MPKGQELSTSLQIKQYKALANWPLHKHNLWKVENAWLRLAFYALTSFDTVKRFWIAWTTAQIDYNDATLLILYISKANSIINAANAH